MRSFKKMSLVVAALMASSAMVQAADLLPPTVEELPPEIVPHVSAGGWYIRGDIGYSSSSFDEDQFGAGTRFFQGPSLTGIVVNQDIDDTLSLRGGIGYQVNDYLRVDTTLEYFREASVSGESRATFSAPGPVQCNFAAAGELCNFSDSTGYDATTLLANAYVDLGTISGITPYVGAGIGGAHVTYDPLFNTQNCVTPATCGVDGRRDRHAGEDQWRFAWAVHAGASYDINCRLKADAGYTFTRIEGGKAFAFTEASGFVGTQGFDNGIDVHTGRVGLRYALSDSGCTPPPPVHQPVVYK